MLLFFSLLATVVVRVMPNQYFLIASASNTGMTTDLANDALTRSRRILSSRRKKHRTFALPPRNFEIILLSSFLNLDAMSNRSIDKKCEKKYGKVIICQATLHVSKI